MRTGISRRVTVLGRAETPRASRKSKARAKDEKSNKFWQVIQKGKTLVLRWGRIGDKSQEQTKQLESEDVARAQAKKLIDEKQRKGYVVAASSPSSRSSVDDDVLSTLSACAPLARNDWAIVDVDTFELTLVPLAHAAQLQAISKPGAFRFTIGLPNRSARKRARNRLPFSRVTPPPPPPD